jgi:hypothetical protein
MRDLPMSVCYRSPASPFWAPRILRQNEGLSVGCAPNGPAKYFWVLGRYTLETFLRSACLEWLRQTLCSYARYLNASTLHTFNRFFGSIVDQTQTLQLPLRHHQQPLHVMYLSRSYWVSSNTGHRRLMASLRSARLQGLPEVGPARLLAAMPGDLCVSTLHLIKTVP